MSNLNSEGLYKAGDLLIDQLDLITSDGIKINLKDFLVEINIFEDIFSNSMKGTIALVDSRNLINLLNLRGEESLIVKFRTPSFKQADVISKTFRTYRISDRKIVRDNNTQIFTLHFVSSEMILDTALPVYLPFEGIIHEVVESIFNKFINIIIPFFITFIQSINYLF